MLDCKQASQLISQSLDRQLSLRERFVLKLHLLICEYCTRFGQQVRKLRVAIKQMTLNIENDSTIEMPLKAKERIATLVDATLGK